MRSIPAVLAAAAILTLGLSGCVPEGDVVPSGPLVTRTPAATPPDTPEPAVTDAPAGGFDSTPVTIDCNQLVPPQVVYDYNPNYGHQPDFTPAAGTDVATITANQGLACNWVNQTSGETFVIAVAQLAPADLEQVEQGAAAKSTPVSGLGDAAYFTASGGVGVAQVFAGPYWIVATSPAFYEIAEPRPLVEGALAALGQ
jgi:hypothetical protein